MKEYNVTIMESQVYSICVEAESEEEAHEKALQRYGFDGELEYSNAVVTEVAEW